MRDETIGARDCVAYFNRSEVARHGRQRWAHSAYAMVLRCCAQHFAALRRRTPRLKILDDHGARLRRIALQPRLFGQSAAMRVRVTLNVWNRQGDPWRRCRSRRWLATVDEDGHYSFASDVCGSD